MVSQSRLCAWHVCMPSPKLTYRRNYWRQVLGRIGLVGGYAVLLPVAL